MTFGKWASDDLYDIISPLRHEDTEKDIEEIFAMFCQDNPTEVPLLEKTFGDFTDSEIENLRHKFYVAARKWMYTIFYHRNRRTRHPAFFFFEEYN